ncbi:MAG: hemolysin family protein [Spirochaetia bacterium]
MKKPSFFEKLLGKQAEEAKTSYDEFNIEIKEMIRGIIDLSDKTVKEVIIPRIDVVFLSSEMNKEELLEKVISSGHSKFPVFHETIDNVIGILYVKDLLKAIVKEPDELQIDKLLRKPYFVPESKRLESLLQEFQRRRVHIAVAVDEYGGVSGIICLEDIIEEIVGDIQDEFDNEREDIIKIGPDSYLCDARADIEDINEELTLSLPDDQFDTLGGFVFDLFGKIPVRYEKVSYDTADFIIQNMDGHKIRTVKIVLQPREVHENAD